MSNDSSNFLFGGSAKYASFPTIGTTYSGAITDTPVETQRTDIKDGTPLTWDNGKPITQLEVKIQTGNPDENDPDDDGVRKLYIKGKSMTNAVRDAVKAAGSKKLEVGGRLTVTYIDNGVSSTKGFTPPKLYSASYEAPNASESFLSDRSDPWESAAPAPLPTGLSDEAKAALEAAGLSF